MYLQENLTRTILCIFHVYFGIILLSKHVRCNIGSVITKYFLHIMDDNNEIQQIRMYK